MTAPAIIGKEWRDARPVRCRCGRVFLDRGAGETTCHGCLVERQWPREPECRVNDDRRPTWMRVANKPNTAAGGTRRG